MRRIFRTGARCIVLEKELATTTQLPITEAFFPEIVS